MKIADVKIGEKYITKVSGSLVRVVVCQRVEPDGGFHKSARFRVRRDDDGKVLGKTRAASALRPLPEPDPISVRLVESAKAARALGDAGRWADAVAAWDGVKEDAHANGRQRMAALAEMRATAARTHLGKVPPTPAVNAETAK